MISSPSAMEGGGESVIAIIQGLQDAGLAVTLMTAPRTHSFLRSRRRVPVTKSSVHTNTEARQMASAQICDTHYTSSYQLAHCRLYPSSPSPDSPEFPLQRQTPSKTQGNFKFGKFWNANCSERTKRQSSTFSRCRSPSLQSDTFVDSLRKYPVTLGRCASTELVQRLLDYTQAKHFSRNSSRSMRSTPSPLPSRDSKHRKTNNNTKRAYNLANKYMQSCTQVVKEIPTVKEKPVTLKKSSMDKSNVMRRSSRPAVRPSGNYNYLRTSSSRRRSNTGRTSEVRYLNGMKRYIRSTIRQMIDSTPVICPETESRYREHRKSHHHDSFTNQRDVQAGQSGQLNETYNYLRAPASGSRSYTGRIPEIGRIKDMKRLIRETIQNIVDRSSALPCPRTRSRYIEDRRLHHRSDSATSPIHYDREAKNVDKGEEVDKKADVNGYADITCDYNCPEADPLAGDRSEDFQTKSSLHFHAPSRTADTLLPFQPPCICIDKGQPFYNTERHDFSLEESGYSEEEKYSDDESDNEESEDELYPDIEEEVYMWLTQLPVYLNNTEENQAIHREMARGLVEKLINLKNKPGHDDRAMKEIETFIDSLPILTVNEEEEETAEEVSDEDTPVEIKSAVEDWLDDINLYIRAKKGKMIPKEKLLNKLMKHLEPIIKRSGSPEEMKTEIMKILPNQKEDLIEHGTFKNDMSKYTDDLVNHLNTIVQFKTKNITRTVHKKHSIKPILKWLVKHQDIPKNIIKKLEDVAANTDEILQKMLVNNAEDWVIATEINKFLDSLPEDKIALNTEDKSLITENLLNELKFGSYSTSEMSLKEKKQQAVNFLQNIKPKLKQNKCTQSIFDWLDSATYIPIKIKKLNRKLAQDLDKKLQHMNSENVDDDVVQNEIHNFLELFKKQGLCFTPQQKKRLAKNLSKQVKPRRRSKVDNQPISNWLEFDPLIPNETKKKNQNLIKEYEKIIQGLKLQNADDDLVYKEIKQCLDLLEGIPLTPKQKKVLAKNLLKDVKRSKASNQPVSDWLDRSPQIAEKIKHKNRNLMQFFDNKLQQMRCQHADEDVIEDEIRHFLDSLLGKGISLTPEQKIRLSKNILGKIKYKPHKASDEPFAHWLSNLAHIPENIKEKNQSLMQNFDKKLQQMISRKAKDDEIEDEIRRFINLLPEKGIPLTPQQNSNLVDNIFAKVKPKVSKENKPQISDWSENAPSIPENINWKHGNSIEHFDKKFQQMKPQNSNDVIHDKMQDFVHSLPSKGKELTVKQSNEFTNDLLREKTSSNINQPVAEWLKKVQHISEEEKLKILGLVEDFDRNLQQMNLEKDDKNLINDEIRKFVNSLPNKCIQLTPKQKHELTRNLLRVVKKGTSVSKQLASNWLENTSYISEEMKLNAKKAFTHFDRQLQQMKLQNLDVDTIENEIKDFVNSLTNKGIQLTTNQKNELTRKLLETENSKPSGVNIQLDSGLLKKSSQTSDSIKKETQNVSTSFDRKLQQKSLQNSDGDDIENEVKEFKNSVQNEGIQLTPKQKNIFEYERPGPSGIHKQPPLNWLENVPHITDEIKQKTQNEIEKFHKKLQQKKLQNIDSEAIKDEIRDFVDSLSSKGLSSKQKSELSRYLIKDRPSIDSNQPVLKWLEKASDIPEDKKENKRYVTKKYNKKLKEIKPQNDAIEHEMKSFIDSLPSIQKNQLTKNVLEDKNSNPATEYKLPVSGWLQNAAQIPDEVNQGNQKSINSYVKKSQSETSQNIKNGIMVDETKESESLLSKERQLPVKQKKEIEKKLLKDLNTRPSTRPILETSDNSPYIPKQVKQKNQSSNNNNYRKLQQLKSENVEADIVADEVNSFLDSLSSIESEVIPKQKNEFTRDLLRDDISNSSETSQPVSDWLENIFDIPEMLKKKSRNLVKLFYKKIQQIKSQNLEDNVMEIEVKKIVDSLPYESLQLTPQQKNDLIRNILEDMKSMSHGISKKPKIDRQNNFSFKPEEEKHINQNLKGFDRKLKRMKSQNVQDNALDDETRNFKDSVPRKSIQILRKQKSDFTKDVKPKPSVIIIQPFSDWLKKSPIFSEKLKTQNRKVAQNFDKTLQQLKSQNASDDIIEDEIIKLFESLSGKGISLPPEQITQLVAELLENSKTFPKQRKRWDQNNQHKSIKDAIVNEISGIIDDTVISTSKKKEIIQKISDLLASKFPDISNDDIKQIESFLKQETNIPKHDFPKIVENIMRSVKSMHLSNFDMNSQSSITDLRYMVIEEVDNILNEYDVPSQYSDKIEKSITKAFTDQIIRGTSDHKMEKTIMSLLKSVNLSEDDAKQISDRLIRRNREMSPIYGTLNSSIRQTRIPMQTRALEDTINDIIIDFIQEITGNSRLKSKHEKENDSMPLSVKLAKIMSDPNDTNRNDRILRAILNYLDKTPIETNIPKDALANLLEQRLHGFNFETSTPLKEKGAFFGNKDLDLSIVPKERRKLQLENDKEMIIAEETEDESEDDDEKVIFFPKKNIRLVKPKKSKIVHHKKNKAETKNTKELSDIIESWINDKLINLDDDDIHTFVEGLTKDVVNREKYFHRNNIRQSPEEESEYLKYILFKWLNKFIRTENLPSQLNVQNLIDNILGMPIDKEAGAFKTLPESTLSITNNSLLKWLKDTDILSFSDKNKLKNNISDLTEAIKNKMEADDDVDLLGALRGFLLPWLNSINTNVKDDDLIKMVKEVYSALKKQSNTDLKSEFTSNSLHSTSSSSYIKDSRQLSEKRLEGGLLDWLKHQLFYLDSPAEKRRIQEKIMKDLADKLILIIEQLPPDADLDPTLLEEINNNIRKLPMKLELESNKRFINELPQQILNYVKSLQLHEDISPRNNQVIDNYVDKWLKNLPLENMNSVEKARFEDINGKLRDKIKNVKPGDEPKLRITIKNFLESIPLELDNVSGNENVLMKLENQLINSLNKTPLTKQKGRAECQEAPETLVTEAVELWEKTIRLPECDKHIYNTAKSDLIKTLTTEYVKNQTMTPLSKEKELFKRVTGQFLEKIKEYPSTSEDIDILADLLKDKFTENANQYVVQSTLPIKLPLKKGADELLNAITNWVKNLPIETNTPKDITNAEHMRQNMETKLIHKIGELNMNPEINDDDFLYEEMLGDEIDSLLLNILSTNVETELPILKKVLLEHVRRARKKICEENAGIIYKQELRDAISRVLPSLELSKPEGKALLEVLKDEVADSFVNMHYVGNDPDEIIKLKNKIADEINKFCMAFCTRCPATLDTRILNHDLYNAMNTVTEPQNESFREEVELIKIREVICNWLNELPLKCQSGLKRLQTNRLSFFLAKKLHSIEKDADPNDPNEYKKEMNNEINKFLNKLPLGTDNNEDINQYAEKLIKNLRDTEASRRRNAFSRHSIDATSPCIGPCYIPPPCTLTKEDQDHIETIRRRNEKHRKLSFNNVSSVPCSVNFDSQTDLNTSSLEISQFKYYKSSRAQTPCGRTQAVGSQIEVSPKVVVSEHYWNSIDESCSPREKLITRQSPFTRTQQPQNCSSPTRSMCSKSKQCFSRQSQIEITNPRGSQTRPCGSQNQIRERPECQLPYRLKQPEKIETATHCSSSQSGPYQQSQLRSPRPNYQSHAEPQRTPLRTKESLQKPRVSSRFSPNTTCDIPIQNNMAHNRPSQYKPGRADQLLSRDRRSFQENQSIMTCPPLLNKDPGRLLQGEIPLPKSRVCKIRSSTPPTSSDYEPDPSCSFQKRVTHLGSFDHTEPRVCKSPFYKWSKTPDFEYWENDRNLHCYGDEFQRKRHKYNQKCVKYDERRNPCHNNIDKSMNNCAKCCGVHCPFPSHFFFR